VCCLHATLCSQQLSQSIKHSSVSKCTVGACKQGCVCIMQWVFLRRMQSVAPQSALSRLHKGSSG